MKIINTASGLAYQLTSGTQLKVERPNLFFNEYGEQTFPLDLPDTDLNRKLTGYSDMLANRKKPFANIQATIQDGEYFMPCRQAILGAQRKKEYIHLLLHERGILSVQDIEDFFGRSVWN